MRPDCFPNVHEVRDGITLKGRVERTFVDGVEHWRPVAFPKAVRPDGTVRLMLEHLPPVAGPNGRYKAEAAVRQAWAQSHGVAS